MLPSSNQDDPPRSGPGGARTHLPEGGARAPHPGPAPRPVPLVTSRNNSHPPLSADLPGPFRVPRPYVQRCGTGTLAISRSGGSFTFGALLCGSWSCAHCRRVLAARLLDRVRRGMLERERAALLQFAATAKLAPLSYDVGRESVRLPQLLHRSLATLTLDPSKFGAKPMGYAYWTADGRRTVAGKGVRRSIIWTPPTAKQFREASEAMSKEFEALNKRLRSKAKRQGVERHGYLRVIELHRSGWPHYHVVIEHPTWSALDIEHQVSGWSLGSRVETKEVGLDDAVGELAPYLVSKERGKSSKAYQFAATALPGGFRLYSASQGFLPPADVQSADDVDHAQVLRGHFMTHHRAVVEWGADSRILLPPPAPADRPHRAPGRAAATGDGARRYYVEQLDRQRVEITPEQAAILAAIEKTENASRTETA